MSDTESNQAYNDASEASIPAENGPREVANDPPPLGSAEESENDPGVAARTRLQRAERGIKTCSALIQKWRFTESTEIISG